VSEREPSKPGALPRVKGRLPFDANGAARPTLKRSALVMYAVITFGLVALAVYMAVAERLPLMSPWVLAPAIDSLLFVLRLFMILGSRG